MSGNENHALIVGCKGRIADYRRKIKRLEEKILGEEVILDTLTKVKNRPVISGSKTEVKGEEKR